MLALDAQRAKGLDAFQPPAELTSRAYCFGRIGRVQAFVEAALGRGAGDAQDWDDAGGDDGKGCGARGRDKRAGAHGDNPFCTSERLGCKDEPRPIHSLSGGRKTALRSLRSKLHLDCAQAHRPGLLLLTFEFDTYVVPRLSARRTLTWA